MRQNKPLKSKQRSEFYNRIMDLKSYVVNSEMRDVDLIMRKVNKLIAGAPEANANIEWVLDSEQRHVLFYVHHTPFGIVKEPIRNMITMLKVPENKLEYFKETYGESFDQRPPNTEETTDGEENKESTDVIDSNT